MLLYESESAMNCRRPIGMVLPMCLIFLAVVTCLALGAMENNVLTQKMGAAFQAQLIAFNSAEAGLIAEEAKINGETVDMSAIKGELTEVISSDTIDDCQQHTYNIISTAIYQNAQVKLLSAYLKARQPPLPDCPINQPSHRLWWQPVDV